MDDRETRRRNLRLAIEEKAGGNQTRFAEMIGKKQSYISDLLRSPTKSFGEKAARSIEKAAKLGRGYLDREESMPSTPSVTRGAEGEATPLGGVSEEEELLAEFLRRFHNASREQRAYLLGIIKIGLSGAMAPEISSSLLQLVKALERHGLIGSPGSDKLMEALRGNQGSGT